MREYEDRREIDNMYEMAKKRIKEKIELKGLSMKGAVKGQALSEIMAVFDDEMGIGITEEMITARRLLRDYYKKYYEVNDLNRKIYEKTQQLKEQQAVEGLVSMLTDDVLKNAIIAYNSISEGRNRGDAKEIAIAYITAKGREDLKDTLEV